jgi:hypothetical protein
MQMVLDDANFGNFGNFWGDARVGPRFLATLGMTPDPAATLGNVGTVCRIAAECDAGMRTFRLIAHSL